MAGGYGEIPYGITEPFGGAAGPTTTVHADLTATYNVRRLAGASLNPVYNVRKNVGSNLTATYNVLVNVSPFIVHADLVGIYNVVGRASADLVAIYKVGNVPDPDDSTDVEDTRHVLDLDSFANRLYNLIEPVLDGKR